MADICISYRTSDRVRAAMLRTWFEDVGWSVWMDRDTEVGENWEERVADEFARARAVVVVWSAQARRSEWVAREAEQALSLGRLVQIQATALPPPEPFDRIQAVRMESWSGEDDHAQRSTLTAAVAKKIGVEPPVIHTMSLPQPRLESLAGIEAAINYCVAQLEFQAARSRSGLLNERLRQELEVAFDNLLVQYRVDGSSADDRDGVVHALVGDFVLTAEAALGNART